jgi:acetyl esterase/lipase
VRILRRPGAPLGTSVNSWYGVERHGASMQRLSRSLFRALASLALVWAIGMNAAHAAPRVVRGVKFASVDGAELALDLYLPDGNRAPLGVIVWVHGGAWRAGSRASVEVQGLSARGWAIASVDYRLSTVARFPAQVHDIKAAIRFLRAHAA